MRIGKISKSRLKDDIHVVKLDKDSIPECEYIPDVDIDEQKSVDKYVKMAKSFIRSSLSYKSLMDFIKFNLDLNTCMYFKNVTHLRGDKIGIEIHHVGVSITMMIETVLRKRIACDEDYSFCPLAKEVMYNHYRGAVSLVPLSTTIHEAIHAKDSKLFIPIQDSKFGNSQIFYDEYKDYMSKEIKNKYEKYFLMSKAINHLDDIIPSELNISIIYYYCNGINIPDMSKLEGLLENVA